jgi:catechol 2,3-dioxygenase-like lactoylglutathione lyase family enzyme
MTHALAMLALVVRDYDEAIAWYTGVLGFALVEDTPFPGTEKRWVVLAPGGSDDASGARLLLARAADDAQATRIGNQAGGRVFLFLHTDDIARDVAAWSVRGVAFDGPVRDEAYGRVVVFTDLYGNRWDLIEPRDVVGGGTAARS